MTKRNCLRENTCYKWLHDVNKKNTKYMLYRWSMCIVHGMLITIIIIRLWKTTQTAKSMREKCERNSQMIVWKPHISNDNEIIFQLNVKVTVEHEHDIYYAISWQVVCDFRKSRNVKEINISAIIRVNDSTVLYIHYMYNMCI